VGSALGGILLLGALLAWFRSRRKHTRLSTTDPDVTALDGNTSAELEGRKAAKLATELPNEPDVHEVDAQTRVPYVAHPYITESYSPEALANAPRSELP